MVKIFVWRQKLGRAECPYMERWVLNLGLISIRLHHWFYGDDPRHMHDHPWDFVCLVLKGSYVDVSPAGNEPMPQWTFKYRPATHLHTVDTSGCWTLLLTGPERREWGFLIKNKLGADLWVKAKKYFKKRGHHPCQ